MNPRTVRNIGVSFLGAVTITMAGVVFAASFSDIRNSKSKDAIQYLSDAGIIGGYSDGTFRPDTIVNRAEFLKVLTKMTGADTSNKTYRRCFSDVTDEWFAPFICFSKNQKWIGGYKDGTFKPGNPVSTVEAIKIMITAGKCASIQSAVTTSFTDVIPGTWYAPYVQAASNAGLLLWVKGKVLGVNAGLTRGQMSEMLYACMIGRASSSASSSHSAITMTSSSTSSNFWKTLATAMHRSGGGGGGTTTVTITSNEQTSSAISSSIASSSSSSAGLITPTVSLGDIAKNYGDSSFTLSPTSDSAGAFSYISGNTAVATISGNTVTIVAAGSAIITVNQAANGAYGAGSTTATLTVSAIAPTLGTFTNVTKQIGDIPFTLTAPVSNSAGAFSYVSGNTGIATISGNTVTLVSAGTTTITATQAANGNYTSGVKVMTTFRVVAGQCELEEPCLYEGVCTNLPHGTYSCVCTEGHSGSICEMDDSNCNEPGFCLNGGTCTPTVEHGECSCAMCYGGWRCDLYVCL